jgi:toxin YoeB
MKVTFTEAALREYFEWQAEDKKTVRKINELIKDIQRNGFLQGIGKPETLKHRPGFSRRIDAYKRHVYTGSDNQHVEIISCKGHYEA